MGSFQEQHQCPTATKANLSRVLCHAPQRAPCGFDLPYKKYDTPPYEVVINAMQLVPNMPLFKTPLFVLMH